MRLYHGSNIEVKTPCILPNLRRLDFGCGFYLTSSEEQARRWARSVTRRRNDGRATLNTYEFDQDQIGSLDVLQFEEANGDWLDFVVANRKGLATSSSHDIVIGPVANDSTLPVIDDYMRGTYPKRIAIELLQPQNLMDQYAFLTNEALACLSFISGEQL